MTPFPLPLTDIFGPVGVYFVYIAIGFAFGMVLEMSGFANSTKLAAQFYLKDHTVLKVMFGAIVVAMILIFAATGFGLLDYNKVWVNPTYLVPGIVGGLVMGFGFIIGGFCPGTSLVAAATGKIDGVLFVLGAFFGMFLFGETVGLYDTFWHSTDMGRFTLPEFLNLDTGVVVVLIAAMALVVFFGVEQLERILNKGAAGSPTRPKWRIGAAGVTLIGAFAVMFIGQPTTADRWSWIEPEKEQLITDRAVQVHPGEYLSIRDNHRLNLITIDVRDQRDYNLFHLRDAQHIPLDELEAAIPDLMLEPSNTVFMLVSNDETQATEAWRMLQANSVPNVYLLEGGVNQWLALFGTLDAAIRPSSVTGDDQLRFAFGGAHGERSAAAAPHTEEFPLEFTTKVQLQSRGGGAAGGCG